MANIFNSVKGLHPKRNKFSADTYRNDFTAPLGVNIPCYVQEVPAATRIKVSASALVRLQALLSPVMDNLDYYTHFWKVPYRLLEDDRFTKFFTGEIEAEDYDALFATPYELSEAIVAAIDNLPISYDSSKDDFYEMIVGNGSLLDFIGYDRLLFPDVNWSEGEATLTGGNNSTKLNWRGLIVYFMLHVNWYMNENVEYFEDFVSQTESLVKNQDLNSLSSLLVYTAYMHLDSDENCYCSFLPHGWDKDYFTSALPNTQYGDPVTLPLGGSAPVTLNSGAATPIHIGGASTALGLVMGYKDPEKQFSSGETTPYFTTSLPSNNAEIYAYDENEEPFVVGNFYGTLRTPLQGSADLSEATAITINELRFANALQVFKERQMRFGRRRLEFYKGFFDVSPEDLRMQVPKYLGGGRIPINIADIEQTSKTDGSSALGHLAGKATGLAGGFAGFTTFCSEESVILGISFAIPHITYANSLSRFKMKTNDIYDYFNPSFEHLGEQAIKNIEVYTGATQPNKDFGYTPRYTEYRFHSNEMHGAFKDTLSFWSLGRIFSSQPALNAKFVYMQPRVFDRIFAVTGQPNMVVSMLFHVQTIKPVSKWGTPMLLA